MIGLFMPNYITTYRELASRPFVGGSVASAFALSSAVSAAGVTLQHEPTASRASRRAPGRCGGLAGLAPRISTSARRTISSRRHVVSGKGAAVAPGDRRRSHIGGVAFSHEKHRRRLDHAQAVTRRQGNGGPQLKPEHQLRRFARSRESSLAGALHCGVAGPRVRASEFGKNDPKESARAGAGTPAAWMNRATTGQPRG